MSDSTSLGSMADDITGSFTQLTQLITASSYVAGTAFAAASVLKFKAHSDNPTQVPISTPMVLLAVSVAVSFLAAATTSSE